MSSPNKFIEQQNSAKWFSRTAYKDLGKLQIKLTKSEKQKVVQELFNSIKLYEDLILSNDKIRNFLYKTYNKMVLSNIATSQLSNQFNMSMKGHNTQVQKEIDSIFKKAHEQEKLGNKLKAKEYFQKANLNYKFLFCPDIIQIIKVDNQKAYSESIKIKELREKLFCSTIKMVIGIARKHYMQLDGNILDWADLAQEALIGAMQAVESYQPIDNGKTFTSFVYTWVEGITSKKVNELTRTVPIPRTTLDRYVYIYKAIEELGLFTSDLRGEKLAVIFQKFLPTKGILQEGKIDYETLSKIAERATTLNKGGKHFTPEEVRLLLIAVQDEISLNVKLREETSNAEHVMTLDDTIPDESISVEDKIDGMLVGKRLLALIKDYLTEEEYEIMAFRYGNGVLQGYKQTAEQYMIKTGKLMNRGKAAAIEAQVIQKLKRLIKTEPDLVKKFREIMQTIPLMEHHL